MWLSLPPSSILDTIQYTVKGLIPVDIISQSTTWTYEGIDTNTVSSNESHAAGEEEREYVDSDRGLLIVGMEEESTCMINKSIIVYDNTNLNTLEVIIFRVIISARFI